MLVDVTDWVEAHAADLVELTRALVSFDTRGGSGDGPPENEEGPCQAFIADYLRDVGCHVEFVEPDPQRFSDHPMMPAGHHWRGRAMTLARVAGTTPGARSLAFNGHIDVVGVEPRGEWTHDPFTAVVREGRIFGRGTADMKGGLAAAMFAVAALRACDVRLEGDLWLQAVTDEETSGMGTVAMTQLAPLPSVAVFPEPTGFDAITSCRGVLFGHVDIPGRAAHAELPQPDWRDGGGVNAITRLPLLLDAIERLNDGWASRRHAMLASPSVVPTMVAGGDFAANIPAGARLTIDATYLPGDAGEDGFGGPVRQEIESSLQAAASADGWLAEHPLRWTWFADYPPYEAGDLGATGVDLLTAARAVDLAPTVVATDSWHDAATMGRFGGIPAFSFGPGDSRHAHAVDESIAIDELVLGAKALASVALRLCRPVER